MNTFSRKEGKQYIDWLKNISLLSYMDLLILSLLILYSLITPQETGKCFILICFQIPSDRTKFPQM